MKAIAILLLAMLIASPAQGAPACASRDRLIPVLDQMHHNAPDISVREYRDPQAVAAAMKFINDFPKPTHYTGDAIVVVASKSHGVGYVVAVYHGCILTNLRFPIEELEKFVDIFLTHQGNPA